MALINSNFIPQLWSARLLTNLDNAHVFAALANRDYEGEITSYGSQVKINQLQNLTVGKYVPGTPIGAPNSLTGATPVLLNIDQADFIHFTIDDIDAAQQNPKLMDRAMQRSAYALAEVTDKFVAGLCVNAAAGNVIGSTASPVTMDKNSAYEYIVNLGILLDKANIPDNGRWIVLPPEIYGELQLDTTHFIRSTGMGDQIVSTGFVGSTVNGFQIYKSNNVPTDASGNFKIIAGHNMAVTFAEQILDVTAYEPEQQFATNAKGLHVYGGVAVQPSALAVAIAAKPVFPEL